MKTIGFPISHKENEKRRAILPNDLTIKELNSFIYFEKGYGNVLGIDDSEYEKIGCHIVDRNKVLLQDIICDPKIGDAEYLDILKKGQIIFGWIHATQSKEITDKLVDNKLTAYAWEKMFENGRHVFWRNNELAGEAAILHAFQCYGKIPYNLNVAIIGSGNTARGAIKMLYNLGAKVTQYNRRTECLIRNELNQFDVIVNCILWDVSRKDHIIYKEDLHKMKKGSLIIDISCDAHGGIETSVPTTIDNPVYEVDNVMHYVVDHTPSIFYKTFSESNSKTIYPYVVQLMKNELSNVLNDALIVRNGDIIDTEICIYQNRPIN